MFSTFHIAYAIFQWGRNYCYTGSGRVAKRCIWSTKLGQKRIMHMVVKLLLFSAPPIWRIVQPSQFRIVLDQGFLVVASVFHEQQNALLHRQIETSASRNQLPLSD